MTTQHQASGQRRTDQAGSQHHHLPAGELLRRALRSGSVASLLSTLAVSAFSRRHAGSAAAGTNATSQWFWYPHARHVDGPSLRYTLAGYTVHHASSVFWACGYEALRPRSTDTGGRAVRAAGVAALAYLVDYHVVPRRLSPGFEDRVLPAGVFAAYAMFALGLFVAAGQGHGHPRYCGSGRACPSRPTRDHLPHWSSTPAPAVRSAPASPA